MLTSSSVAHPELSDNLRRRLCSLWRSDSNVTASLSKLELHHSREQMDDGQRRKMLSERTIMLAIAALWQGLAGADVLYSFGNGQLFADTRCHDGLRDGNRSVPQSDILLMPLFFWTSIENPSRDDVGNRLQTGQPEHGLIAAARKGRDLNVTFTFLYSRPCRNTRPADQSKEAQEVERALICQTAREVVRRCGWFTETDGPHYNGEGDTWLEVPSAFVDETPSDIGDNPALDLVPEKWNTMGHHMILNAWAYMLDIPLEPEISYALKGGCNDPFYAIAEELIDLALQGRVNGDVIKQFMTEFRYAKKDDDKTAVHRIADNNYLTRLRNERSVLINQKIFDSILNHLQQDPSQTAVPRSRHLAFSSHKPSRIASASTGTQSTGQATAKDNTALLAQKTQPATLLHVAGTWRELSEHNLAVHEAGMERDGPGKGQLHTTENEEFRDEHVWRSIMSVWCPLWESDQRYAFGTEDTFSAMRDEITAARIAMWAVGNRQMPFLMPMRGHGQYFDHGNAGDAEKGKKSKKGKKKPFGGVGHWILAIATFDEKENRVDIRLLNSATWMKQKQAMEDAAEGLCRWSGWLGLQRAYPDGPYEAIPFSGSFKQNWDQVPEQDDGVNCGLHVVMSAWAILLGIPIGTNRTFRKPKARFYQYGRRVIDCALAGHMDSRTIQAFLNAYGFAAEQDINSREDDVVRLNVMSEVSEGSCLAAYQIGRMNVGTSE